MKKEQDASVIVFLEYSLPLLSSYIILLVIIPLVYSQLSYPTHIPPIFLSTINAHSTHPHRSHHHSHHPASSWASACHPATNQDVFDSYQYFYYCCQLRHYHNPQSKTLLNHYHTHLPPLNRTGGLISCTRLKRYCCCQSSSLSEGCFCCWKVFSDNVTFFYC